MPYQSSQVNETIGQTTQIPAANTSTTSSNGVVIEDVSAIVDATLPSVVSITNTPAVSYTHLGEEGGENGSAKGSFVREGYFKDVDAALSAHPGVGHRLTEKTLGCVPLDIEFWGKASHAAAAPEQGINALDALIQTYNSINALRQHLSDDERIHGIIVNGGQAPDVYKRQVLVWWR